MKHLKTNQHATTIGNTVNRALALALTLFLLVSASETRADITFDAAANFSASENPNGPWSLGWSANPGTEFNLYTFSGTVSGLKQWSRSQGNTPVPVPPTANFNPTDDAISISDTIWAAKRLTLHPGPAGEHSVVRWVAPTSGTVTITAAFEGRTSTTTDVNVFYNGARQFAADVNGFSTPSRQSFSTSLTVATGDKIDFTVGYGSNGNYSSDTTQCDITISLSGVVGQVQPQIEGAVAVSWPTDLGVLYQVQYTEDLANPSWTNIGSAVAGNGATKFFYDTTAGKTKRFYRVSTQ